MKKFEEGDRIKLEDLYTGRIEVFTITKREPKRAILTNANGRTKAASITQVRHPPCECLDVTGYNAVFSLDSRDDVFSSSLMSDEERGMGRPPKMTAKDVPKVLAMRDAGVSTSGIAQEFGVSARSVRNFAHRHGVELNATITQSEATIKKVMQRRAEGACIMRIADEIGVSPASLARLVREHRIPLPVREPRRKPRKLTEEDLPRFNELRGQGLSFKRVAYEMGVSVDVARAFAKSHGIEPFREVRLASAYSPAVQRMLDDGCTQSEIADYFNVPRSAVCHFVKKYGLKVRKKWKLNVTERSDEQHRENTD